MPPFSFVHAADLHLDSPFVGVTARSPIVAEKLRAATFEAFDNIIDLCISRRVDFLLVAGDVFDGADRSLRAQLRFRDGLARLAEKGVQSFVVHGNHDPLEGWTSAISWPAGVHIFGSKVTTVHALRSGEPLAAITGVSYPKQREIRNLAQQVDQKARQQAANGPRFCIGLLHANVGNQPGHEPYAPCEVAELTDSVVNYWALGHVHTRQIILREPHVSYPGNPQGRNIRECGARGCLVVEVNESRQISSEFVPVDAVRWESRDVDVSSMSTLDVLDEGLADVIERLREQSEQRALVCQLRLVGRTALYADLARAGQLTDLLERVRERHLAESPFAWVERIEVACLPEMDLVQRRKSPDLAGEVLRIAEEIRSGQTTEPLTEVLLPLYGNTRAKKALNDLDEEGLRRLLAEAELLCVDGLESFSS